MSFFNLWQLSMPLVIFISWAAPGYSPLQEQETDETRGAFLVTRKNPEAQKSQEPARKTVKAPVKPRQTPVAGKKKPEAPPKTETANQPADQPAAGKEPVAGTLKPEPGAIGVGYTLYQRSESDEALRVNPAKTFRSGDKVRFVIEPSIDGYLYIFVRTDDGEPEMLFPDHRLNNGENKVRAHVPYETPSRKSEINWFTFDPNPGIERLYIVISREPLPNAPAGKDLIDYCKGIGQDCSWKPAPEHFKLVLTGADEPKIVSASKSLGQAQAQIENEAITRGIKLKAEAPEPVIVQMNLSASKDILVMKTELNHRPR